MNLPQLFIPEGRPAGCPLGWAKRVKVKGRARRKARLRSKASLEYSGRRAGKKQRQEGQCFRWSKPEVSNPDSWVGVQVNSIPTQVGVQVHSNSNSGWG